MFNQLFFGLGREGFRDSRARRHGSCDGMEMRRHSHCRGHHHHKFEGHEDDRGHWFDRAEHCRHEFAGRGHDRFGPEHGHGRGRGGFGRDGDGHDRRGKLRRLFDHGDLRIVMLALLAKKPSHGYELIKAIEEATSGLYVPSPGVIYPTLTLLEEQDLVDAVVAEKGRKRYQITEAGQEYLQQNNHIAEQIFARLAQKSDRRPENLAEGILQPMHQFRSLMREAMMNPDITPEQVEAINETLSRTIAELEQIFAQNESDED